MANSRHNRPPWLAGVLLAAGLAVGTVGLVQARYIPSKKQNKEDIPELQRALVLDGKSVHNVGQLQMHLLNWGEWGSRPGTGEPYSLAPSAQWPAGSGVEYLFSAGLWVGALRAA